MLKYMIASAVVALGLSHSGIATEGTMQPPAQPPVNVENPDTHEGKSAHKHHHKKYKKHKKNHKKNHGKNHEMKKEDKKEEKKEEKPAEEKK
jgi:hypothetical protein